MQFPELSRVNLQTVSIDSFAGLNRKSVISAGEFSDCMNVSNDEYPCMSVRKPRAIYDKYKGKDSKVKSCEIIFYNEGVGYICNGTNEDGTYGHIIYGGKRYDLPFKHGLDDITTANMGRRVVINNGLPVWNKGETCVFDLPSLSVQAVGVEYTVINETDGSATSPLITGGSFCHIRVRYDDDSILIPNMDSALDADALVNMSGRSDNINHLVAYGEKPRLGCVWYRITKDGGLQVVNKLRYEFCAPDIHLKFNEGDYIKITMSGAFGSAANHKNELSLFNGWYEIVKVQTNIITVSGKMPPYDTMNALFIDRAGGQRAGDGDHVNNLYLDDGAKIERLAPQIAYICESNNRIWGCDFENQICCCELGNPYNWYRFEGLLTDSYYTSTGEDGRWTGAVCYDDKPTFFKEDMIYRISGSDPSSFGVYKQSYRGVAANAYHSLCVVNDILYYQATDGIYMYNGTLPSCISEKVHSATWRVGKAGRYKDKYILSVIDDGYETGQGAFNHNREIYSFDSIKGTWQRESPIYAYSFANNGNTLYILEATATDDYTVYVLDDTIEYSEYEGILSWYAETGPLVTGEYGRNYIRKIQVDASVGAGSRMAIYIQYNNDGRWIKCRDWKEQKRNTVTATITPKRSDNIRLKFEGNGECEIYSIILGITKGSDKR